MKTKVLFILAFFLIIGFQSSAQTVVEKEEVVEISKLKTLMVLDFTLEFYPKFNNYSLIYRINLSPQIDEYRSISLGNKENALKLRKSILDFLDNSENEGEIFNLMNNSDITWSLFKDIGWIKSVVIRENRDNGSRSIEVMQPIDKNKIEKLFPSETFN